MLARIEGICQPFSSCIQAIACDGISGDNLPGSVPDIIQLQCLSKLRRWKSSFQILLVCHHKQRQGLRNILVLQDLIKLISSYHPARHLMQLRSEPDMISSLSEPNC